MVHVYIVSRQLSYGYFNCYVIIVVIYSRSPFTCWMKAFPTRLHLYLFFVDLFTISPTISSSTYLLCEFLNFTFSRVAFYYLLCSLLVHSLASWSAFAISDYYTLSLFYLLPLPLLTHVFHFLFFLVMMRKTGSILL